MKKSHMFAGAGFCVYKVGQATDPKARGIPPLTTIHEISKSQDYFQNLAQIPALH